MLHATISLLRGNGESGDPPTTKPSVLVRAEPYENNTNEYLSSLYRVPTILSALMPKVIYCSQESLERVLFDELRVWSSYLPDPALPGWQEVWGSLSLPLTPFGAEASAFSRKAP